MPLWLKYYDAELCEELEKKLLKISPSTIDRLLKNYRTQLGRRIRTTTTPGLRKVIPLKRLDEKIKSPGSFEGDTVAHCGDSCAGLYISRVQYYCF